MSFIHFFSVISSFDAFIFVNLDVMDHIVNEKPINIDVAESVNTNSAESTNTNIVYEMCLLIQMLWSAVNTYVFNETTNTDVNDVRR